MNFFPPRFDQNCQTVLNFCRMDPRTRGAALHYYGITLPDHLATAIQRHFMARERRDPTVDELKLLATLAAMPPAPDTHLAVAEIKGTQSHTRVYADICRMLGELGQQTPPALIDLAAAATRYLARAGIHPFTADLCAGTDAILAARAGGIPPRLVLELSGSSAALLDAPEPRLPAYGMLFLLLPAQNSLLATDIARLLTAYRDQGVMPLAVTQNEGLLPHVLAFSGAQLDVAAIPGYTPVHGTASLVNCGRNCLLFSAPPQLRNTLLASSTHIRAIGTLAKGERLTLTRAGMPLFSLPLPLLRCMQAPRVHALTLTDTDAPAVQPKFVQSENELLGGVELLAPREADLLAFLCEAAEKGADMAHATVAITLELPQNVTPQALGAALPLLLVCHRACAELTLPASTASILYSNTAAPRLSLFLTARKKAPRALGEIKDFATARAVFYGK